MVWFHVMIKCGSISCASFEFENSNAWWGLGRGTVWFFCKMPKFPLPPQSWHSSFLCFFNLFHDFTWIFQTLENSDAMKGHLNSDPNAPVFSCTKLVQTNFVKSGKWCWVQIIFLYDLIHSMLFSKTLEVWLFYLNRKSPHVHWALSFFPARPRSFFPLPRGPSELANR